ncbi:type IV secretion system protein [Simonsiella muelleri]|uniref:type IV secretion system protein n=1 Tax=Simonsiella muelleri TaxID=72 RepID=UPI0023F3CF38|nr:type IV secretion system protein [Simonsiella muelleri]
MDLSDLVQKAAGEAGDFALYTSIRNYIYARIEYFMEFALSRNLSLALTIVVSLLTLWIMIQGFLIATGRSQDNLKAFVFNLGKSYFIILLALGVSSTSAFSLRTLTETLTNGVASIMSEEGENINQCIVTTSGSLLGCKIDKNLSTTQAIMGFINQVDTANNPILEEKVEKAKMFAGIGSAGPGIVAGTVLILYRVAMALFVGFAPIFILCLLFKKTAPLFQKWLFFGLATIFSSVLLAVMADISADLIEIIAKSLFVSKTLLEFTTGQEVSGISQAATQQLGVGIMLSTLLIIVPPMAGTWFNGVMGTSYGSNYFGGWNGGQPPPAGSGAGSGAHGSVGMNAHYNQNNTQTPPVGQMRMNTKPPINKISTDKLTQGNYGSVDTGNDYSQSPFKSNDLIVRNTPTTTDNHRSKKNETTE